jgi:hypothetical protein
VDETHHAEGDEGHREEGVAGARKADGGTLPLWFTAFAG